MGSGAGKQTVGACTGTGATIQVRGLNFKPKHVKVFNVASGGLCDVEWIEGMDAAAAIKRASNGDCSVLTSLGITQQDDGFDIGADNDINVSGEQIRWVASE